MIRSFEKIVSSLQSSQGKDNINISKSKFSTNFVKNKGRK